MTRHLLPEEFDLVVDADAGVDTGPIIDQRAVRVEDGDTEESLHERIKAVEREMLVDVVRALAAERGSGARA